MEKPDRIIKKKLLIIKKKDTQKAHAPENTTPSPPFPPLLKRYTWKMLLLALNYCYQCSGKMKPYRTKNVSLLTTREFP